MDVYGCWMGSLYKSSGERIEVKLVLDLDSYERTDTYISGTVKIERGTWTYQEEEKIINFFPSFSTHVQCNSRYEILELKDYSPVENLMVLRWIALVSCNLPILFYRVYIDNLV